MIGVREERGAESRLGILLALAYPERIAKRRDTHGERYQLSGGTGAVLPKGSPLAREKYLAVGDVDGAGSEVRVFLASPIKEKDLLEVFRGQVTNVDEVRWDSRSEAVVARRIQRLGMIELSETNLTPPKEQLRGAMLDGIRSLGLHVLPWTKEALSFQTRSEWVRRNGLVDASWPELSTQHLGDSLNEWLGPHLDGVTRQPHLERLNLLKILRSQLSSWQLHELDKLAPTHLTVPTGSRIPLDYSGRHPVLAVRLQEMFGETETPTLAGGRVKVMLHLLSPAHRPLAVTQDLPSFWKNAYIGVRKDMRGQYPKHVWPENPLEAEPTKRSKRKVK
jgi:ATP-dependent helicase HrpB